ncbi:MAG: tRNA (N(6)-L-threonylcarbamoyladenosine(37)-C(2))-methylthiotransferase MtaB [Bacteroidetes bacterium]|nr:tRNA (N(6)-L-threonylcarbamoyladenosine(37)-C(2))-methylthiotransferase MtaB [Bacteroidota bacterium]
MAHSVALYTLGCKLNFAETGTIGKQLTDNGFLRAEFTDGADMYVINTCSVTDHADRKCKKVVAEALRYNPNAYVVVVGCYAQLKPVEISQIPGVDLVLGAAEKFNLMAHLGELSKESKARVFNAPIKETLDFVPGFSERERTRAFVKVQDGCDYFCSFCTIPLARGSSRSANIEETLAKIRQVATGPVREIVLTGVNLGDFGVNHGEDFYNLIQELDKLDTVDRFRISSIEPNLLSNEIIEFVARSQRFVPQFHIPLQSGSDEILGRMRRRYKTDLYKSRVERILHLMPHCAIGVDVIVGFPGETEEEFLKTYQFLNELDIAYLHVFPYSERPNTTAKKMQGRIAQSVRHDRVGMLRSLSEKKRRAFYGNNLGATRPVLFEAEEKSGFMHGFTDNYIKVKAAYDPLLVNEIANVKLENMNEDGTMSSMLDLAVLHP